MRVEVPADIAPASPDETPTDVDLPDLDSWASATPAGGTAPPRHVAVDPDAETAVIGDGGVFVRDEDVAPLAPVVPIERPARTAPTAQSPAASKQLAMPQRPVKVKAPSQPKSKASSQPKSKAPPKAEAAESDVEATADLAADAEPTLRRRDVWRASRATKKTLRREVRRFTARSRRRRWTWIISLSAVVFVVAGSFAVAYSPLFALQKISVVGTSALDPAAVQQALEPQLGAPLASINGDAVRAELSQFPLVETYSLEARPPHELVVRIVERTPIGVVSRATGFDLVDAAGVVLATTPDQPAGQPVITADGDVGSEAFRAAGIVVRALPAEVRALVASVSATTPNDVRLTLAGTGTTIAWGSAEHSVEKSTVLQSLMTARPPGGVTVYDVSSPSAVIVR